jgi:hypothetical protein
MHPLARGVAIWPGVGTTLTESFRHGPGAPSSHFGTALAADLRITICPLPHLVVTAGPFLDLPLERAPVSLVFAGGLFATF